MTKSKPYLRSILLSLLILLFPILSGVIIVIFELEGIPAIMTQTVAFFLAFLVGIRIAKKQAGSLQAIGFRRPVLKHPKAYLYFLPILGIEVLPFFFGFKEELTFGLFGVYLLFSIVVGLTEELYFRGLILDLLKPQKLGIIVLVSSLLFSLGHIANLLAGQDLFWTLIQVVFALVFAVVTALIALATQSFWIPALWHMVHNFSALITADNEGTASVVVALLQCVILIGYAVYLWRQKPDFLSR